MLLFLGMGEKLLIVCLGALDQWGCWGTMELSLAALSTTPPMAGLGSLGSIAMYGHPAGRNPARLSGPGQWMPRWRDVGLKPTNWGPFLQGLAIISNPPSHFIIRLCPDYCRLAGKQLGGFMGEPQCQDGYHRTSPPIGRCLSRVVHPGVTDGLVPAWAQGPLSPLIVPCIPGRGSFSPSSRVRIPED